MSQARHSIPLAVLMGIAGLNLAGGPARAAGLAPMVQAYCLAAFQQEMWQAGKVAPVGMADFACRCVVDRLTEGTSLTSARSYCRESTARRYSM
jgi:hypothetical protein